VVAIVQAVGPGYRDALTQALDYPVSEDKDGETLKVSSAELAIFSAATDGTGPYSLPLLPAHPGPAPPIYGRPSHGVDPGILFPTAHTACKLKVHWYTELNENNRIARPPSDSPDHD
jgi:hypothetical protein